MRPVLGADSVRPAGMQQSGMSRYVDYPPGVGLAVNILFWEPTGTDDRTDHNSRLVENWREVKRPRLHAILTAELAKPEPLWNNNRSIIDTK